MYSDIKPAQPTKMHAAEASEMPRTIRLDMERRWRGTPVEVERSGEGAVPLGPSGVSLAVERTTRSLDIETPAQEAGTCSDRSGIVATAAHCARRSLATA